MVIDMNAKERKQFDVNYVENMKKYLERQLNCEISVNKNIAYFALSHLSENKKAKEFIKNYKASKGRKTKIRLWRSTVFIRNNYSAEIISLKLGCIRTTQLTSDTYNWPKKYLLTVLDPSITSLTYAGGKSLELFLPNIKKPFESLTA